MHEKLCSIFHHDFNQDQLGFLERGKLLNIQKKMADHQKALQAPVRFSDTVDLTRREMDALASETSGTKIGYLAQRKKNGRFFVMQENN